MQHAKESHLTIVKVRGAEAVIFALRIGMLQVCVPIFFNLYEILK